MRQNEESWILTGGCLKRLFWGHLSHRSEGHPGAVGFPYQWVMEREKKVGDVIGFAHTHPGFLASPSMRDDATMAQWVLSFGKSLICLIEGINGLRGYLYYDDERDPIAMPIIKRFGDLIVGITPKITRAEVVGEEDIGGKVIDWDDEMRAEYDLSKLVRVPFAGTHSNQCGRAARSLEPMELTPEDAAAIENQPAKPNIPIEPVQEYKDYFTRTLVRVISVGEGYVEVLIPGWEPEKTVRLSNVPASLCQVGKRFHCQCNINVENERELFFKNFEE
jgi:hypothetical protein